MRSVLAAVLRVGVVVFGVVVFTGCAEGREPPAVGEAMAFSGMALPPHAEVLELDAEHGIDEMHQFAVAVPPEAVGPMLVQSRFGSPLIPGKPSPQPHLDEVAIGPVIASATDEVPPGPGRPSTVHREVLVDRTDPARAVVHVRAFTT